MQDRAYDLSPPEKKPFFDREGVKRMAPEHEFARGEEYYVRGRVHNLRGEPGVRYSAIVRRSTYYAVVVSREGVHTVSSCSCSFGYRGRGVCRHIVAVMMAVLDDFAKGRGSLFAKRTLVEPVARPALEQEAKSQDSVESPEQGDSHSLNARDLMSSPAEVLSQASTLADAWAFLQTHQFRHIPVVDDDGALIGILSERDLLREAVAHEVQSGQRLPLAGRAVSDLMIGRVVKAAPDTAARELSRMMFRERIGCVPIVEADGLLVGIVTRSDVLRAVVDQELK